MSQSNNNQNKNQNWNQNQNQGQKNNYNNNKTIPPVDSDEDTGGGIMGKVLVAIVIIAVIGLGFYILNKRNANSPVTKNTLTENTKSVPAVSDATSSAKTGYDKTALTVNVDSAKKSDVKKELPTVQPASTGDIATKLAKAVAKDEGGINSLNIVDQVAGNTVDLKSVTFSKTGWVAIAENNNGAVGKVLGAKVFNAGTSVSGKIELLRPTVAGGTYVGILYTDDGTRTFNLKTETQIRDGEGNVVKIEFKAQ